MKVFCFLSLSLFIVSCSQTYNYLEKKDKGYIITNKPYKFDYDSISRSINNRTVQSNYKYGDTIQIIGLLYNLKDGIDKYIYLVEPNNDNFSAFYKDDVVLISNNKNVKDIVDSLINKVKLPLKLSIWTSLGAARTNGVIGFQSIAARYSYFSVEYGNFYISKNDGFLNSNTKITQEYYQIGFHIQTSDLISIFGSIGQGVVSTNVNNENNNASMIGYGFGMHLHGKKQYPFLIGINWNNITKFNLNIGLSYSI